MRAIDPEPTKAASKFHTAATLRRATDSRHLPRLTDRVGDGPPAARVRRFSNQFGRAPSHGLACARRGCPAIAYALGPRESDMSVAIQRLDAYCSQIVRNAIVRGTPINAPGMPQRKLQKNTANSTRKGEIARVAPASSGSR